MPKASSGTDRLREASIKSQRAANLAEQATQSERAALSEVVAAAWKAFSGGRTVSEK
jgi:hypothetical protein